MAVVHSNKEYSDKAKNNGEDSKKRINARVLLVPEIVAHVPPPSLVCGVCFSSGTFLQVRS